MEKVGSIEIDGELSQRISLVEEWANCALEVANICNIPEVNNVAQFIGDRAHLGIPAPGNMLNVVFRGEPNLEYDSYFYLTPLLDADSEKLPADDRRHSLITGNSNLAAQFAEGSNAIYLPPTPLSRLGKGVILLHEAKHAKNEIEKRYDRNDPFNHWLEEADTYVFEFEIMELLCGNKYSQIVREEMKLMTSNSSPDEAQIARQDIAVRKLVDRVFGKKADEYELWTTVIQLNAYWKLLLGDVGSDEARIALAHHLQPKE